MILKSMSHDPDRNVYTVMFEFSIHTASAKFQRPLSYTQFWCPPNQLYLFLEPFSSSEIMAIIYICVTIE